ncbi:MAG: SpoIIE family protein phosphatase [Acetobacteraceae bacterium]
MLLRRRIVLVFSLSGLLLMAVAGGSFALLWQWSQTQLANAEQETARARWNLSLEQVAAFYEAIVVPLAEGADFAEALGRLDREAIRRRLIEAMKIDTGLAPVLRIDAANDDGDIIASTAGLAVAAPLVDVERTALALQRGYPIVGPELDPNGRQLLVVTVSGPRRTLLSLASDLATLLPDLASGQRADLFLLDRDENLVSATNSDLWSELRSRRQIRTDATSYTTTYRSGFMLVPLPLTSSGGALIGTLLVVRDVTFNLQRSRLILLIGGVTALLLLGATSVGVYVFTRGALDPLGEVTRVVRALASGNLFVTTDVRPTSSEVGDIAAAVEVFRANAVELERGRIRETLRDAQQHALIRREMARLASTLDEPARAEVLAGLQDIQAGIGGDAATGASALAAGFSLMAGRVAEQHRQLSALLQERTRDLQVVRDALAEREQLGRLREELEFARHLQMSSLPAIFPPYPDRTDFTIYAAMQPAKEVGGDFYDFVLLDDDRLALMIGDASGKGVSAAMFIATCRALVRSAVVRGATPADALAIANAAMTTDNEMSMFATVFLAILDLRAGILRYANGGHNPPYVLRPDGGCHALDQAGGIALGVIEPFEFSEADVVLHAGDRLFLFTDGVTEAHDPSFAMFGEARLEHVLDGGADCDAEGMIRRVSQEVALFVRDADQADDITMLSLVYRGANGGASDADHT